MIKSVILKTTYAANMFAMTEPLISHKKISNVFLNIYTHISGILII